MKKRVLYIVSNVVDSTEYDYLVQHWDRTRFDLEFLLLNPVIDCGMQRNIRAAGYSCITFLYTGRGQGIGITRKIMRHLRASRPDIVNTNLLEATFYGLIAAWLTGIGKRVYTRHHSTHNHKYHPVKGVFYDRIANRLAHRIIAITRSVEDILVNWEKVPKEKVVLIYHGYDMSAPHRPDAEKMARLKAKYGLDTNTRSPIIGIISRPFEWKGLDHSIPAFAELLREHPNAHALFFNWKSSPHMERYEAMLAALPAGSWQTIDFDPEVIEFFHVFDVFIHVPEDQHAEAFGLVYAESTMAGSPCVFTRSGIMHDLDANALHGVKTVPFKDKEAILARTREWLNDPPSIKQRANFAERNAAYLHGVIDITLKMEALYTLYGSM